MRTGAHMKRHVCTLQLYSKGLKKRRHALTFLYAQLLQTAFTQCVFSTEVRSKA